MEIDEVNTKLQSARKEMRGIRQRMERMKQTFDKEMTAVKKLLADQKFSSVGCKQPEKEESLVQLLPALKPIGYLQSIFKNKNGTPRQSGICSSACASLTIDSNLFSNAHHSLEGLHAYSHLWVMFIFHKNNNAYTRAKVKPPRLDGARTGLFSTRCPYRPNPIGLSLCKIDKIDGGTVYLSGVDILDGTPIIDIKPYIPDYDQPKTEGLKDRQESMDSETVDKLLTDCVISDVNSECNTKIEEEDKSTISTERVVESAISEDIDRVGGCVEDLCNSGEKDKNLPAGVELCDDREGYKDACASVADWVKQPPIPSLSVIFTSRAEAQAEKLVNGHGCKFTTSEQLKCAMREILEADPRSSYRRNKCSDRLYYFIVGGVHVVCWFDNDVAEVVKIEPEDIEKR